MKKLPIRWLVQYITWFNQTRQIKIKELRVMRQFNQSYVPLSKVKTR